MPSANSQNAHSWKVVIIGDSACGKTSLLCSFKLGGFRTNNGLALGYNNNKDKNDYAKNPPAFENYTASYRVGGRVLELAIWDMGAQEQYDRLKPLVYLNAHAIIICFSIDNVESLENIMRRWAEEVSTLCAGIPVIIASLKNDLRTSTITIEGMAKPPLRLVTELDGRLAALEIGAKAFIECSSVSGDGVNDVFEAAARAALSQSKKRVYSRCVVI